MNETSPCLYFLITLIYNFNYVHTKNPMNKSLPFSKLDELHSPYSLSTFLFSNSTNNEQYSIIFLQ